VSPIFPFLLDAAFEPEATQAMSDAFDEVCAHLGVRDKSTREREVIASRIINLAQQGERDAGRLRDRLLHEAGFAGEPVAVNRADAALVQKSGRSTGRKLDADF
jgi:putative hemolysin